MLIQLCVHKNLSVCVCVKKLFIRVVASCQQLIAKSLHVHECYQNQLSK